MTMLASSGARSLSHEQNHAGAQHQHDGQNNRLRIIKEPLKPVTDDFHN
jgi:hypothetical protein